MIARAVLRLFGIRVRRLNHDTYWCRFPRWVAQPTVDRIVDATAAKLSRHGYAIKIARRGRHVTIERFKMAAGANAITLPADPPGQTTRIESAWPPLQDSDEPELRGYCAICFRPLYHGDTCIHPSAGIPGERPRP